MFQTFTHNKALQPDKALEIKVDRLENSQVIALVREHLDSMAPTAPPESRHALDLDGLRNQGVRVVDFPQYN